MKPLVPSADEWSAAAQQGYPGGEAATSTYQGGADGRKLRVVLRADAGRTQGTGHVMRLLTLAESLHERGHHVTLVSARIDVPWLSEVIIAAGVDVVPTDRDGIDAEMLTSLDPDWVVVDSYMIPAEPITALDAIVPVLLLADGSARGAQATLYLDQNLGAPPLPEVPADRQLLGSQYALVRRAIRDNVPRDPVHLRHEPPEVLVVLGGTDPEDRTVDVARACSELADRVALTFVAPERQHNALIDLGNGADGWRVLAQTPALPALLGGADAVVSAGGTSAWDLGVLGVPAALLAVVPNQQASLRASVAGGLALGYDVVEGPEPLSSLAHDIITLLSDTSVRARLVSANRATFDGRGGERVVAALERHPRTRPVAS